MNYEKIRSLEGIEELQDLSGYKQYYEQIDPNYLNSASEDIIYCLQVFTA